MNQLILGDCLEVMRNMDSESIDLIYLDPPFFSNRNYEVIWGDKGEVRSFEDRWSGGIDHYISWLKERVLEMHRLLKPTGSIYLHCDYHAFAEIKVNILDKLFGYNNFNNLITWKRADTHNDAKIQFPIISDYIYFYYKDRNISINSKKFNPQYGPHTDKLLKEWYLYLEFEDGSTRKMTKEEIESQNIPQKTRRFNTADYSNTRPGGYLFEYKGYQPPKNGWRAPLETMIDLDNKNLLYFPKDINGRIMRKRYLDEQKGTLIGDLWNDISQLRANDERIGYPTQKPEKLLDRIIQASSNEGDIILDPFVGGGTSVVVADKLGRNWIGIDQSVQAIKVSELRLNKQQGIFSNPFSVILHKYDYDTLRYKDAFQFEAWIVERFGGKSNLKQRGDFGIDGITRNGSPIQVKRSDNIGRNVIDNFHSAIMRYDKALYEKNKKNGDEVGFIIAFSFGRGAIQEVARLKNEENITIKLVTVEEIVPIAKKPKLKVTINDLGYSDINRRVNPTVDKTIPKIERMIEFIAEGESEAGIEFYSFDFNYNPNPEGTQGSYPVFNPSVVLDRIGKQTHKFKPGLHTIAVKAVDSEGLEAIEVIKIKVNGEIIREG